MAEPSGKSKRPKRRAKTVKGREDQLISLAIDLAEEQLAAGTASSQVMTHFLKLGTVKAQVELKKLEQEVELQKARTEALESTKRIEQMYKDALEAMRSYQGLEERNELIDD